MAGTFYWRQSFFGGFNKKMVMLWENNSYIIPFTEGYELQNSARVSPLLLLSPMQLDLGCLLYSGSAARICVGCWGESMGESAVQFLALFTTAYGDCLKQGMGKLTLRYLTQSLVVTLWMFFVEQGVVMHWNDPLWLALGPGLDTGSAGMQTYNQESLISIFM